MDAISPRVLVVDDDPAARLLCAANLERLGLQVLEATDGLDALERARSHIPDLVLTDVAMPGFSGFELAEALRLDIRTHEIPIIFLSGERSASSRARALALGALAYIVKPFDPRELTEIVTRALAQLDEYRRAQPGHSMRRGAERLS